MSKKNKETTLKDIGTTIGVGLIAGFAGTFDVWINNAMISVFGPFKKIEARDFEHVTDVTYLGQVYGKAVVSVARHPERELFVGYPTVKTIWGNKIAPGFLDEYLAKTGYSSQQTDEPESPGRQNNLWHPLPGDHGAHGSFDKESATFSPETWMATHKKLTFGILGAIAGGVCASVLLKQSTL